MDPEKESLVKLLNELKDAIEDGEEDIIEDVVNWFHEDLERNKQLLSELVTSGSQCITQTDLILSACRTRNKDTSILYNVLKDYDILDHLPGANFDDPEVIKQRTEALKQALVLSAGCMVTMYDYWCDGFHWILQCKSPQSIETQNIIKKIETLRESLEDTRVVCQVENETRIVEINSLIGFNTFQHELYSNLYKLSARETPEDTATMLINVLNIYKDYSDLEKIRIPKSNEELELLLKADLDDEISIFQKSLAIIAFEVYFQKLDFNVAWLLLEKSFVLKKYLKQRFNKPTQYFADNPGLENVYRNAVSLYKEFESALFHYVYRTCEVWKSDLSKNRRKAVETDYTDIHSGQEINLVITYDKQKLFYAPMLFLEREEFKKCLNNLKIILEEHVIREDPAKIWMDPAKNTKGSSDKITTLLDDNYLTAFMYISDYYSLRKIVYYIEAIGGPNGTQVLMTERTLQLIGDVLKNTKESNHIMESTKSLLHIAISEETIQYIHDIRDFLSHADKGQVSTRINIANEQQQIFNEIKEDLEVMKTVINVVLNINMYLFDKSQFEKDLRLLDEQITNWPVNDSRQVDEIYRLFKKHGSELFSNSKPYLQELKALTGLRTQLLKEIPWVIDLKNDILSKLQLTKTSISNQVLNILPLNIHNIKQTLQLITDNQSYVNLIKPQLLQLREYNAEGLPIGDHGENINLIKDKMPEWSKNNNTVVIDLVTLNKIKDFSSHWDHITTMLSFCLNDSQLFAPDDPIRQVNVNDKDTVKNVLLAKLEDKKGNTKCTSGQLKENHSFSGIEKLHNVYAKTKAPGLPTTAGNARDHGRKVRQDLIICLISRVKLLKETFGDPRRIPVTGYTPVVQLLQWYKYDKEFRLEIEMILADIGIILVACNVKSVMMNSAKSQREIDLRNVLHHGNPFIEVICNLYDSYDFSSELLTKAIMFTKDEKLFEALFKLFQDEIDVRTIENLENRKINELNDNLKAFYEQFKDNERWVSYLQLLKI